jgi:hypothetical protein
MQAEAAKDWGYTGTSDVMWIPNWNSPSYLAAWENLLNNVATHIANTSFNGVRYRDAIGYIDISGYGNWGEWHNYPWYSCNCEPAEAKPTAASLNRIIDASLTAFPNFKLVGLISGFAATSINPRDPSLSVDASVSCKLANASNAAGALGWRRDSWGYPATWIPQFLESNPVICNGVPLKDIIMNKWKVAPIVGEPYGGATAMTTGGSCAFWDMENEVRFYHITSFGNGNFGGTETQACANDNARAASKATGYRLVLNGGSYSNVVTANRNLGVQLLWRNIGVTPTYESWNVNFELRNSSGATVWTGTSSMNLRLYLPETTDRSVSDTFVLPSGIAAGTYNLVLVVKDPTGVRKPLPLAIQGRAADGAYPLGSVTVQP